MLTVEVKKKTYLPQNNPASNVINIVKKIENLGSNFKSTPTIISRDLKITGNISGKGIIEIEGLVRGVVNGGFVVIREKGFVEGEIYSDSVVIKGNFVGKIKAKIVNIAGKAVISGEIEYESLSVEDGASIDGEFKKITYNHNSKVSDKINEQ